MRQDNLSGSHRRFLAGALIYDSGPVHRYHICSQNGCRGSPHLQYRNGYSNRNHYSDSNGCADGHRCAHGRCTRARPDSTSAIGRAWAHTHTYTHADTPTPPNMYRPGT